MQGTRDAGMQGTRDSGNQGCRSSRMQATRDTNSSPDSHNHRITLNIFTSVNHSGRHSHQGLAQAQPGQRFLALQREPSIRDEYPCNPAQIPNKPGYRPPPPYTICTLFTMSVLPPPLKVLAR